jgi:hypothetical protein
MLDIFLQLFFLFLFYVYVGDAESAPQGTPMKLHLTRRTFAYTRFLKPQFVLQEGATSLEGDAHQTFTYTRVVRFVGRSDPA